MRLRTFHATNMKQAMEMIRDELGDSAVIISSNKNSSGKGVAVTVAQEYFDDDEPQHLAQAQAKATHHYHPQDVYELQDRDMLEDEDASGYHHMPDYFIRDMEDVLFRQGTSNEVIDEMLRVMGGQPTPHDTSPESLHHLLRETIRHSFRFSSIPFTQTGLRMMVVGTPGAGKTLMVAKTAARIVKAGQRVTVITTDYKRAGGAEQLASFTDILGVKLHVANTRAELKNHLAQIPPSERVIMDSAGANPYDYQELKDLSEFAGLMGVEPVLVFPAGGDPDEAAEIARAFSFLGVERMVITRMDLARRYGSILTAAHAAGLAFSYATGTEQVLGECDDMTPDKLANLLLTTNKHPR
jgi:flagellar biosynthesis protein FlhF